MAPRIKTIRQEMTLSKKTVVGHGPSLITRHCLTQTQPKTKPDNDGQGSVKVSTGVGVRIALPVSNGTFSYSTKAQTTNGADACMTVSEPHAAPEALIS